jgi:hypothetical protein
VFLFFPSKLESLGGEVTNANVQELRQKYGSSVQDDEVQDEGAQSQSRLAPQTVHEPLPGVQNRLETAAMETDQENFSLPVEQQTASAATMQLQLAPQNVQLLNAAEHLLEVTALTTVEEHFSLAPAAQAASAATTQPRLAPANVHPTSTEEHLLRTRAMITVEEHFSLSPAAHTAVTEVQTACDG